MTIVHCHFWIAVCWLTFSFSFACLLAVCSSRNVFITKTFVGFDFFLFFYALSFSCSLSWYGFLG